MKPSIVNAAPAALLTCSSSTRAPGPASDGPRAGRSPWGPDDQIGTLNMMTDESRRAILARIEGGPLYDLSVEYFVGMPSWYLLGDPRFPLWMTHTPRGTAVDDPAGVGASRNQTVSYTGDAVSMYTHTGTHIDALNHFGLHGEVWNGFHADQHVGDRGWQRAGAEKLPPIVARGVLIDVAGFRGVSMLPDSYPISVADLEGALASQGTAQAPGDVVLVRTGRMTVWPDGDAYILDQPGLSLEAAKWLVERQGAMLLGGDNLSLEHFPAAASESWVPVHTYLLAERGVPIVEVLDLELLARDRVYEFAFVAAALKWRGASGARSGRWPFRSPRTDASGAGSKRAPDVMRIPAADAGTRLRAPAASRFEPCDSPAPGADASTTIRAGRFPSQPRRSEPCASRFPNCAPPSPCARCVSWRRRPAMPS